MYFLYIVVCADGTLYTGITRDVARRVAEHNGSGSERGAKYTRGRRPVVLAYSVPYPDRASATKEERRIKALTREQKKALLAHQQQVCLTNKKNSM